MPAHPSRPMAVVASPTPRTRVGPRRAVHRWFDLGVLFKGAEGLLEIVAGTWLAFSPDALHTLVFRLSVKELLHDPQDRVAELLRHFAEALGTGRHTFAIVYLVAHGLVKVVLAAGLLRNRRWAYPFAICALIAFAVYQLYRFTHTHSALLPVLSLVDLAIAWLVWREWRSRSGVPQPA